MPDMRDLMNMNSTVPTSNPYAAAAAPVAPAAPVDAGASFGSWGRDRVTMSTITKEINVGAMVATKLRHVLAQHPELKYEEDKSHDGSKFNVTGPAHMVQAIDAAAAKQTPVVDEAEEFDPETHTVIETEEDTNDAEEQISKLVAQGFTSGQSVLTTGNKMSWKMEAHDAVADDEFTQEYISGLIHQGYTSGHNPQWNLTVNIWADPVVVDEAEFDHDAAMDGHDFDHDRAIDGMNPMGDDDGIIDEAVLKPFDQGAAAENIDDCPYLADSPPGRDWMRGFQSSHLDQSDDGMLDEEETEDMIFNHDGAMDGLEFDHDAAMDGLDPVGDEEASAHDEGMVARNSGMDMSDNPYDPLSDEFMQWEQGYNGETPEVDENDFTDQTDVGGLTGGDLDLFSSAPRIAR